MPLIFVMTILVLLVAGEVSARMIYKQDDAVEPCEYQVPTGSRYRPMCSSRTKVWEGPWITQHFNACGYRSAEPCALRPPGSLRVVVVGSSTARGALVDYEESFAARASAVLSSKCGGLVHPAESPNPLWHVMPPVASLSSSSGTASPSLH
jgi:hypothetical protein